MSIQTHNNQPTKVKAFELSPSSHKKLIKCMEEFNSKLLSNIVINFGIEIFSRVFKKPEKKTFLSTLFLTLLIVIVYSIVLYLLAIAINLAIAIYFKTNFSSLFNLPLALVCLLAAISFGVIKVLHDSIFPKDYKSFPENMCEIVLNDDAAERIANWFCCFISYKKQVIWSVIVMFLTTGSLYIINQLSFDKNFSVGSYISVSVAMFAVAHGAYCAIFIPTLMWVISRVDMKLYWLNPADTPWVKDASWICTKLTIADVFIVLFCFLGLYLLDPFNLTMTRWIAFVWLIIGILALGWSFIFPQYLLYKVIRDERLRQIDELQEIIAAYRSHLKDASQEELIKLGELLKQYNYLTSSKQSAIESRSVLGVIGSLASLIAAYLKSSSSS